MREKILNLLLIVIVFIGGGVFGYYYVNHDEKVVYINQSTDTTGVIKCDSEFTVDESGISLAVGEIYDATVTIQNYKNNTLYSSGSGFVYKKDDKYGYILTNHHVIDGNTGIKVTMSNDDVVDGKVLGSDEYLDLAVVQVDVSSITQVAKIGNSASVNLGDTVFTVGTPVSYEYRGTVTRGTLSGKNRMVSVSINSSEDFVMKVLQVDAAINPGNSGGPLVDVKGNVIGINSLKLVENEVEGMGFAIPIEYAMNYVDDLELGNKIERPLIGITMLNVNDTYSLYRQGIMIDSSLKEGVVIVSIVDGSGASKAGLKKGDVITKIGNVSVKNAAYMKYELYKYDVGDTVVVTYNRDGKEMTAKVTLTKSN